MQIPKVDKNKSSQYILEEILDRIGKDEAVLILIDYLNDENPKIRHRAVEILGEIGDEKAVVPVINA